MKAYRPLPPIPPAGIDTADQEPPLYRVEFENGETADYYITEGIAIDLIEQGRIMRGNALPLGVWKLVYFKKAKE